MKEMHRYGIASRKVHLKPTSVCSPLSRDARGGQAGREAGTHPGLLPHCSGGGGTGTHRAGRTLRS